MNTGAAKLGECFGRKPVTACYQPKNLLLISLDTLRFDCISAEEDKRLLGPLAELVSTPNIDSLARNGVRLSQAISSAPFTTPSHAAIFTGLYWTKHRVIHQYKTPLSARAYTLAERLRDAGFATGQNAGKDKNIGVMFESEAVGLRRGFEFSAFSSSLERKTRRWIKKNKNRRWFLFFHTFNVHWPYGKRIKTIDRLVNEAWQTGDWTEVRRVYIENANRVDELIGELLDFLTEIGEIDDTLIVLLSDHGEGLNSLSPMHGPINGGREDIIRVPLIFSCPGRLPQGKVIHDQVRAVDILPTVIEMLGLSVNPSSMFEAVAGESLLPLLLGAEPQKEHPAYFCGHLNADDFDRPLMKGLRANGWKLIINDCSAETIKKRERELRENARKSMKADLRLEILRDLLRPEAAVQLYNLKEDPSESANLAASCGEVVNEMTGLIKLFLQSETHNIMPGSDLEGEERLKEQLRDLGYIA